MQAQLQRIEVKATSTDDHDLAIDHAAARQFLEKRLMQLRKVAVERTQVATLDEHVVLAAKDDRAKSIPFRLEQQSFRGRKRFCKLCQHGFDGRRDRKIACWR